MFFWGEDLIANLDLPKDGVMKSQVNIKMIQHILLQPCRGHTEGGADCLNMLIN